ncbi:NAD(P)-dependent oxidoreductase [Psychromarinibacter halotolerans]|nr:NAD(P)-dependent oxidoreductase [Psychromarinibacter halotolerans]MDF0598491.1 NAD(P)-dependent oxidoreductase [Psychromarinibacter halotolerans]
MDTDRRATKPPNTCNTRRISVTSRSYGFVGLGNMGLPMARRLLEAGYSLSVFDTRRDVAETLVADGATVAESLSDLGRNADVVFMSLPTPDAVKAVCLSPGGLREAERAEVIVDLSTTGPRVATEVAQVLSDAGKTWIDCPVSGGVAGARKGTLTLMVSGDAGWIETLAPVIACFGKQFVVGTEAGSGHSMKIINNLMSSAALAVTSECLVLGRKLGLEPETMLEVLNSGSGRNSATTDKIPNFVLPGSFDFGFAIALSSKDARLCLEEGDRMGVPMIVGNAVRQLMNIARDSLGPDADMTEVIRVVEGWAGAEVRGKDVAQKAAE